MTEEEFKQQQFIPDESNIYRQTPTSYLTKAKGANTQRFPRENHFTPDEDGLSVNWDTHCTLNGVYQLLGISHKYNQPGVFKNCKDFHVFRIPVSFLRSIDGIEDVIHNSILNGNPAPIGSPNNYSHSLILYPNDPELRLKLSDYCRDNHPVSYCEVDFDVIEDEILALRALGDETRFHRLNLM